MCSLKTIRHSEQPSATPAFEAARHIEIQLRHAEQFAYFGVQDMAMECAAIVRATQALRP
ncbi:hypothetical protein LZ518_12640 [Sphingomonas sp. RB56-2]|uniref:Uncharacterized protein n=1 Tax=Sphingomonas brevis TaxID=2908206 RepID=A0ABT0SC59_9SPHN|nr:hypothetical protein [Sphingomonas brevis]MCL6741977.1 hypothetical protein [Sphingomonas brevis]